MECIICLTEINNNQELVISGCCNNYYHDNCIKNWIKSNINNNDIDETSTVSNVNNRFIDAFLETDETIQQSVALTA